MKKFLAAILAFALMLSLSVCAFAADELEDVNSVNELEDVSSVDMPEDVSVDSDEVKLGTLRELPDPLKAEAEKQAGHMRDGGYMIFSGFGVWCETEAKTSCTVKLGLEDVPAAADIFVNGQAILPEIKEDDPAHCYFSVPQDAKLTKSVVLIAMHGTPGGDTATQSEPYYPSPSTTQP